MSYSNKNLNKEEKILKRAFTNKIVIIIPVALAIIFFVLSTTYDHSRYDILKYRIWFLECIITFIFVLMALEILIKILTTELCFTNQRVIGKYGLFATKTLDMPIAKVNDISITKNIFGHMFNYGTIVIQSSSSKYIFQFVKNPDSFKNELSNLIAQGQNSREIQGKDNYDKLKELKKLLDDQVITKEEFEKEKRKLLE